MKPAPGAPRRAPKGEVQTRTLFANADFLRLWGVGFIVFLVRWLEMLAISLFVYRATGSAFAVTAMVMLRMLPMGLFGAVMGSLAERVEAKSALVFIIVASRATSAVLALLAWTGQLAVWHLGVASFVNGIAWAADNPVRRMMIGQVVGSDRMGPAMSADVGSNNASRMLGPLLAGVIFAAVGVGGAFVASVAFYAIALVTALTLRYRSGVLPAAAAGVLAHVAEGVAMVRRDARLKGTLIVTIIFNLFAWPFTSLVPVIGQDHLGLAPRGIGVLVSMDGVGAFAGALAMAAWSRPSNYVRSYLGGAALYMTLILVFAVAREPLLAGFALLCCGFAQAGFSIMQATLVYQRAPARLRSRALGLLSVCIGLGPIGFAHVGLLADAVGANNACLITGLEGLLALLLTRRYWQHC